MRIIYRLLLVIVVVASLASGATQRALAHAASMAIPMRITTLPRSSTAAQIDDRATRTYADGVLHKARVVQEPSSDGEVASSSLSQRVYIPLVARASESRVGDPGSVYDPSKYDPRFPQMQEWAKAGVQGGIPNTLPVLTTLRPGDNVQSTLNTLAQQQSKGVVVLSAGTYTFNTPFTADSKALLDIPSGLVVRGQDKETTILRFSKPADSKIAHSIRMNKTSYSGLEHVTIINADVQARPESEYMGKYDNVGGAYMTGVRLDNATNSWVQNTKILYSNTQPLEIWNSKHITVRDNLVEKSYNKGGKGNGYYYIIASSYVLAFNETVRDIRHFTISGSHHVVVLDLKTQVDINYHNLLNGLDHNLVEGAQVNLHPYHYWGKGSKYGFEHYRDPVGEGNLVYKVNRLPDAGVYQIHWHGVDKEDNHPYVEKLNVAPPSAGTFYPVTGRR